MKKLGFIVLMALLQCVVLTVVVLASLKYLNVALHQDIVDYVAANLTSEERRMIYSELIADSGSLWDVLPEHRVGRIGKQGFIKTRKNIEVRFNNAGMRSVKPFGPKKPGVFRIVCLGDSFVFGSAGHEKDRFSDQLESFYRSNNITVGNKWIETYALGLEGWTLIQETAYLSSRISSYDPDLIILMTAANDISDSMGVTGTGHLTQSFSPQHREWGSGVFTNRVGVDFDFTPFTALTSDLSPEAQNRWEAAIQSIGRLVDLQNRRSKKILISILNQRGGPTKYFQELFKYYAKKCGLPAPWMITSYFAGDLENQIPHDGHPSRKGHEILRNHFIHALNKLGWITVPSDRMPAMDPRLALEFSPEPDMERLTGMSRHLVEKYLKSSLDFQHFEPKVAYAFLGGIFPENRGKEGCTEPPWASIRSAFLLKCPESGKAKHLEIILAAPPMAELFPLSIDLSLNGTFLDCFEFEKPNDNGCYRISADLKERNDSVLEVMLETESYFTTLSDARMKSYRLISACVR